ncbi:hypothetical protein [Anaerosporobacter sp.]|uniref:hypothetical protein n=1 Tax=Anaerosporobacter sp. TaxID=1872529 RepID=UPI00286F394C|nr:hypothetical protein [Anaerosporobacter sp.]
MALSKSQRITLQILAKNRTQKMNYQEIAKQTSEIRPMDISNALRTLANKDFVYQFDMQGRTTITGDGMEALMD